MNISELIATLQEYASVHGDIDVEARSHGCCNNSHHIRDVILEDFTVVIEV